METSLGTRPRDRVVFGLEFSSNQIPSDSSRLVATAKKIKRGTRRRSKAKEYNNIYVRTVYYTDRMSGKFLFFL